MCVEVLKEIIKAEKRAANSTTTTLPATPQITAVQVHSYNDHVVNTPRSDAQKKRALERLHRLHLMTKHKLYPTSQLASNYASLPHRVAEHTAYLREHGSSAIDEQHVLRNAPKPPAGIRSFVGQKRGHSNKRTQLQKRFAPTSTPPALDPI